MSAVHYCNPLFTAIDWPTGCWCRSRNVVYLNQVRYLICLVVGAGFEPAM